MRDDFDPSDHKPSATDRAELPTAYGGHSHAEPQGPGQSLGQQPDLDDAGVDEAADRPAQSGSTDIGDDLLGVSVLDGLEDAPADDENPAEPDDEDETEAS